MKDFHRKGTQYVGIPFKRTGGITGSGGKHVKNERCKQIADAERFYDSYHIPTGFLPNYEFNGNREMKSLTALLKENNLGISAVQFNKKLLSAGILEEKERQSSKEE
mgnify:CR=1 FL=1